MANETEILSQLPPELVNNIDSIVTLIQIFGGVILIYLIFGIINIVINHRKNKELKKINEKLEQIFRFMKKHVK